MVEAFLQGGGPLLTVLQQTGNPAQFGGAAGGYHQGQAATVNHLSALIQAVQAFRQAGVGAEYCLGILLHRQGFTGEGRLLHRQPGCLQQPQVRRHPITGLEYHHIPGHQLLGGQALDIASDSYLHHGHGQGLERRQGRFSPALLEITKQGIEQHDHTDRHRIFRKFLRPQIQHRRNHRHGDQQQQHDIDKLINEDAQLAAPPLAGQSV